jgi:hypothetical protein
MENEIIEKPAEPKMTYMAQLLSFIVEMSGVCTQRISQAASTTTPKLDTSKTPSPMEMK